MTGETVFMIVRAPFVGAFLFLAFCLFGWLALVMLVMAVFMGLFFPLVSYEEAADAIKMFPLLSVMGGGWLALLYLAKYLGMWS